MAKPVVPPKSVDELFDDLTVLKLKIALLQNQEAELDRQAQECEDNEELQQYVLEGESRILKHIKRNYRRSQARNIAKRTIPQMVRVAAIILLFCYIGLTVAIAADSSVRIRIMEFIMNVGEQYTEFGFRETDEYMEVPTEWQGYYYPSYIPEGFVIKRIIRNEVQFERSDGLYFDFCDIDAATSNAIDTENADTWFISINGHSAMIIQKELWTSIIWSIDNRVLMINYTGEREEVIKIAESVRMIR